MDKTTENRISKDAAERYPATSDGLLMAAGYNAGATAENSRAQKMADALEKALNHFNTIKTEITKMWPELANKNPPLDWVAEGEAALQQWKGEKEVENEG